MKKLEFADWLGVTFIILMTLCFLLIPAPAEASEADWGKTGHRIVGEIAERQLTDEVKEIVYEILDGESLSSVST